MYSRHWMKTRSGGRWFQHHGVVIGPCTHPDEQDRVQVMYDHSRDIGHISVPMTDSLHREVAQP